jgi:3-dehydroquinate synthase
MHNLTFSWTHTEQYSIVINYGLRNNLARYIPELFHNNQEVFIVIDEKVSELYSKEICENLTNRSIQLIVVPSGEEHKSLLMYQQIIEELVSKGMKRRSILILIGGGVIMDMGGFVGATFMRGVPVINLPTTLVAQIDAAVGGKVAVNHKAGKNLIGAFYNPKFVGVDLGFLHTLDVKYLREGLSEIIKTAVIDSIELFEMIENNYDQIFQLKKSTITEIVKLTIESKIRLLQHDPLENDLARPLNFGHTLAHPLETLHKYGRNLSHGEAVAIGMATATRFALKTNVCDQNTGNRIIGLLKAVGLPITIDVQDIDSLREAVSTVIKIRNGNLNLVLPQEIGKVSILPNVSLDQFLKCLSE